MGSQGRRTVQDYERGVVRAPQGKSLFVVLPKFSNAAGGMLLCPAVCYHNKFNLVSNLQQINIECLDDHISHLIGTLGTKYKEQTDHI